MRGATINEDGSILIERCGTLMWAGLCGAPWPDAKPSEEQAAQMLARHGRTCDVCSGRSYENDIPAALAIAAHNGTSWTPERRGDQVRAEYAATLAADYERLHAQAEKGKTLHLLEEEFARYRSGAAKRQRAYLASSSRCVSSMIAGPSGFPGARMQKRADVAMKRMGECVDFRERAMAAIIRTLRPDLQPIRTEDDDAVARLRKEIAKAESVQTAMKACNAAIRKHAKAGTDAQVAALLEIAAANGWKTFDEIRARKLLQPDFCGRIGFADYETKNNGANIRRLRERLAIVEAAKAAPVTVTESAASGVTLEDDPPGNRVRLIFPGKPAEEVRDRLKANGFRWAPSSGAWQAFRNPRSLAFAAGFARGEQV